jgi:mannose-6-phosphate isomerase-like protein (cupin superfamily)
MSNDDCRAQPGDSYAVMSEVFTFLVTSAQSADRLVVVAGRIPPGGSGTGLLHTHEPDEVFHVVNGSLTVLCGEPESVERIELTDGQSTHVPGQVPHLFRNQSDKTTEVIFTYSPGTLIERFFVTAGKQMLDRGASPTVDLEEEIPRVTKIAKELGMQFLDDPQPL